MDFFIPTCLDNHAIFRVFLQAMARPGTVRDLPNVHKNRGSSIERLAACVLDPQVGFTILGDANPELEIRIYRSTGARPVAAEDAQFLLVPSGDSREDILKARRGRLDYPDEGATVIYGVETLVENVQASAGIHLSGPGIQGESRPIIEGLASREWENLHILNQEFPLGVDAVFITTSGKLLCIPRSTIIKGV